MAGHKTGGCSGRTEWAKLDPSKPAKISERPQRSMGRTEKGLGPLKNWKSKEVSISLIQKIPDHVPLIWDNFGNFLMQIRGKYDPESIRGVPGTGNKTTYKSTTKSGWATMAI